MRAVLLTDYGDVTKLSLGTLPDPNISPGHVLVEIDAVGLNHLDLWIRRGLPRAPSLPHILGSDIAGRVLDVGPGVDGWQSGDPVVIAPGISCGTCAYCSAGRDQFCARYVVLGAGVDGGYAELISVPVANVIPMPSNLTPPEAATLPLGLLTVWNMLVRCARLEAGEVVLVQAAASGVGSLALQLANVLGGKVFATASTEDKRRRAVGIGAIEAFDSGDRSLPERIKESTNGRGADVVIEHVGKPTFLNSINSLADGGRVISCGATVPGEIDLDLTRLFWRRISVIGSRMGRKSDLRQAFAFVEDGAIMPVLDRTFTIAEAQDAHRYLENGQHFGKVALASRSW